MHPTPAALSERDLDRLDEILMSDAVGDDAMPLTELHGYLTAVVSGPTVILPSEWLPSVWGEGATFETMEQAQEATALLMSLYNEISGGLNAGEPFAPLISFNPNVEGEPLPIVEDWCYGYVQGMALRGPLWHARFDGPLRSLLAPILRFGVWDENDPENSAAPTDLDEHREWAAMLPEAAMAVYAYWREQEKSSRTIQKAPTPGRNEPCPCGSGKKYKKCHGAVGTLH
jgi:uncharacterized protein